jgi:hypothetical protein
MSQSDTGRLIETLYEQILEREPDEPGLEYYTHLFNTLGILQALPIALKSLLRSDEYNRKSAESLADLLARLSPTHSLLSSGLPISHIVSLGTHCLTANILKSSGLKRFSMPFDWLFTSPDVVIHCLQTDFSIFLDKRYFRSLTAARKTPSPAAEHDFYLHKFNVQDFFAHHDPLREHDFQYFTRCVERFRRVLKTDDAKLFVMISRPVHSIQASFDRLVDELRRVTNNFGLVSVQLLAPSGQPGVCGVRVNINDGDNKLYAFQPSSEEDNKAVFTDKLDELIILRLIGQYRTALKDLV